VLLAVNVTSERQVPPRRYYQLKKMYLSDVCVGSLPTPNFVEIILFKMEKRNKIHDHLISYIIFKEGKSSENGVSGWKLHIIA
jgi:hypothetical protein